MLNGTFYSLSSFIGIGDVHPLQTLVLHAIELAFTLGGTDFISGDGGSISK